MNNRTTILALATGIALGLAGCAGEAQLPDQLEKTGWKPESTLAGAESETGDIAPRACRRLLTVLNRQDDSDDLSGYRHARRESYLLIREWRQERPSPDRRSLRAVARACPRMTMSYGPTRLDYSIKITKGEAADTRVRLTAREETGEKVTSMVVADLVNGSRHRLIRAMNEAALGRTEHDAIDLIARN
ncbi:hypothetical protein [Streptomyces sp. H27-D2]|uniref:hypothetical protein n=1 Tax=Streptomyces sp. H27-D2 TaxID=3046304 RepID=UPI002DB826EA|nr:hypothetical protein [Streptomyces sp. H27-D2]MEC4019848.1 hypothetical protein [Streptomyces sp. H27-D2]